MGEVDHPKSPGACLLVEGPEDVQLLRHLLAYVDIPFTVEYVGSETARTRPLLELLADHKLIIVSIMGQRPPPEVISAIVEVSLSPRPVLLLAADRATTAEWPAALHNLPVVFTDGDPGVIGKRLRVTVQLLVSDYERDFERAVAAQVRAERAKESVYGSDIRQLKPTRIHPGNALERLEPADALVGYSGTSHRQLVVQAREDSGSFLEQKFGVWLVQDLGNRALEAPGDSSSRAVLAPPDRPWDAAIWVDALGSPNFNPVLVKYGRDERQIADLQESMFDLHLLFGIFIHDDGGPEWEIGNDAIVVSIGIHQLAHYSKRQFRKLMVETRDRLVLSQP
ncbi:hypothetical protein ABZ860_27715 [Microbispora sp. NPDC046973]|uniref:hypothetical protein n=1 Tax=Microbispora sp. NPDC046973 TaxID=3155022 RepID=UPI0034037CC3